MTNLIRLVGTSAAEGEGSSLVDFSPAPRQSWTMRGSSCCLLIHVLDTHSSTKSGTFFFSFELCALFGGRSLTAHLGELLAGGGQVRPPVDEGPGRPGGGRREGWRGSRILARAGGSGTPRGRAPVILRRPTRPKLHLDQSPPPELATARVSKIQHFLIFGHVPGAISAT